MQAFVAVARRRTLRQAAEDAGLSAATLSRRLDDLETSLGEKLVERLPTGCEMTAAGHRVMAWAQQMEEIALEVERTRDLKDPHGEQGVVRINTNEWISYFLATRFAEFRKTYPLLEIEILTSHRPYSLSRREADISIRPHRPTGEELVTRKIGDLRFGLYCSRGYESENREEIRQKDWAKLAFVGFDEQRSEFAADRWMRSLTRSQPPWLRCSYALGIYDGVMTGAGLGVLAQFITQSTGDFVPVMDHISELDEEIWMTTHRAVRGSARIRAVTEFVADTFRGVTHSF